MNNIANEIQTTDVSARLKYKTKGDSALIEDVNPPIFILPFVMDSGNRTIQSIFLHEYKNMYGDTKTTVLDISAYNFDSNIDVVNAFVSKYFAIPTQRIDIDRLFYLGECECDISLFKSTVMVYGVNITGFVQDNEKRFKLDSDDSYMIKTQYYDIMKGHYMDVMTMSSVFQLMSYFMY